MTMNTGRSIERVESGGPIDPGFIDEAVDFIRVYADRCHHGKEEDILFRELGKKALSFYDRLMMEELVGDHRKGRENVAQLVTAKERYLRGEKDQSRVILDHLRFFVEFYPKHMEKEDRHFFLPSMSYLAPNELEAMLAEEQVFDRELIHRIYREKVAEAGKDRS